MLYEANIFQMQVDDHIFWVAESKSLKGCVGQGETSDGAITELEQNELEWVKTAKEFGIPIPPKTAKVEKSHSGKFSVRISPILHKESSESADLLGISLNQYANDALAHYNGVVKSEYYKEIAPAHIYHDFTEKVVSIRSLRKSLNKVPEKIKEM